MQYKEFIDQVQQRGPFDSRAAAEQATEESLATFGERLYRTQRSGLAAQLPNELQAALEARATNETTRQRTAIFDLEEFYHRVSARTEAGFPLAQEQAKAVFRTLKEAVTPGELNQALETIPDDFRQLF